MAVPWGPITRSRYVPTGAERNSNVPSGFTIAFSGIPGSCVTNSTVSDPPYERIDRISPRTPARRLLVSSAWIAAIARTPIANERKHVVIYDFSTPTDVALLFLEDE